MSNWKFFKKDKKKIIIKRLIFLKSKKERKKKIKYGRFLKGFHHPVKERGRNGSSFSKIEETGYLRHL